jgi:hypothetical protein
MNNPFHWDWVQMNLPGSYKYDCGKPWVSKVWAEDMRITSDFVSFVDDVRPTGPSKKECRIAARQIGSMLNYLGIQDALRKRQDSSQTPGAWWGSVVQTDGEGVYVLAAKDKWIKAKALLNELKAMMEENKGAMSRKRLEQIQGFFIYVTRTYPGMVPYLIGIHMTIDGWRDNRQKSGWRLPTSFMRDIRAAEGDDDEGPNPDVEPPVVVGQFHDCGTTLTCSFDL